MIQILTEKLAGEKILQESSPNRLSPLLFLYTLGLILLSMAFILSYVIYNLGETDPNTFFISSFIGFLVVGLAMILKAESKARFVKYYVTNKRVIKEYRFLTMNKKIIKHDEITDVKIEQSGTERMFNKHTIHVFTASKRGSRIKRGSTIGNIRISWINNGPKMKEKILNQLEISASKL